MRKEIDRADQIATEVENIVADSLRSRESFQKLEPAWQEAGKRIIRNGAVVEVLSDILTIPKSDVVGMLAKKMPENADDKLELRIAVKEGLNLAGDKFGSELLAKVKSRLE
jgi:hypothetical protein